MLRKKAQLELAEFKARQFDAAAKATEIDSSMRVESEKMKGLEERKKREEAESLARAKLEEEEKRLEDQKAEEEADRARRAKEKKRLKRIKDKEREKKKREEGRIMKEEEEKRAKKAAAEKASSLRCDQCSRGIVREQDAFEKFDKKFCSSKCTREYKPPEVE